MQQTDRTLFPGLPDLVESSLLSRRQLKIYINIAGQIAEPVHHPPLYNKHTFIHQSLQLSIRGAGFLQQSRFSYLPFRFLQMQVSQQQFQLFGRPPTPIIQQRGQLLLITVHRVQHHITFLLGRISILQRLPDKTDFFFDEPFDNGIDMGGVQYLLDLGQFQFFFDGEGFRHQVFIVIEMGEVISCLFIKDEDGLAAQFEVGGQGGGHHLSFAAEVVPGDPFP